jgi:hypothetical protein
MQNRLYIRRYTALIHGATSAGIPFPAFSKAKTWLALSVCLFDGKEAKMSTNVRQ